MLRIISLMENTPSGNRALINEHGLSLLIDDGSHKLLFDCGSGSHFMYNAHKLGIPLDDIDAVVISHSHYDHAAGFRDFAEAGHKAPHLYVGKGFFEKKYAVSGVRYTDLSAGWDETFALSEGFSVCTVEGMKEILPGMTLYQGFPRVHEEETIPERFVRETPDGFIPDDFSDEIALSIKTEKGLVVIVGCSHPGIMNMIDSIRARAGEDIYALFGGTHLVEADDARIRSSICGLRSDGVGIIGMCHCSGLHAEEMAREELGASASGLSVGDTAVIG